MAVTSSLSSLLIPGRSSSSSSSSSSIRGRRKSCVGVAVPGTSKSKLFEYINDKRWNDVIELLNKKPNESKVWGEGILKVMKTKSLLNGNHHRDAHNQPKKHNKKTYVLPLHIALQQGAPIDVITKLVELFPKALQKKDTKFKRYPLHFACLYHPNNVVVKYIMEQYQQALWYSDILERLPIHYVCFNTKTQEQSIMVQILLQNFPLGAQLTDKYGWIPLHIAIRNGTSFDTMKHLVGVFPSGLFVRTLKGSTSKDLALQCSSSSSTGNNNNTADRTSEHVLNDLNVLESAALALLETSEIHSSFISIADAILAQRNNNINSTNEENAQLASTALNRIVDEQEQESSSSLVLIADETKTLATTADLMNESSITSNNNEPAIEIDTCVICLESYSTHIFVPCGHLCICQGCINDMEQSTNKMKCTNTSSNNNKCCPVCRKPSFMTLKVYAS